jgi:hypothetical protein
LVNPAGAGQGASFKTVKGGCYDLPAGNINKKQALPKNTRDFIPRRKSHNTRTLWSSKNKQMEEHSSTALLKGTVRFEEAGIPYLGVGFFGGQICALLPAVGGSRIDAAVQAEQCSACLNICK